MRRIASPSRFEALSLYLHDIAGDTLTHRQEIALARRIDEATRDAFRQLAVMGVALPELASMAELAAEDEAAESLLLSSGDALASQRAALGRAARIERRRQALVTTLDTGRPGEERRRALEREHIQLVRLRAQVLEDVWLRRAPMEAIAARVESARPPLPSYLPNAERAVEAFSAARRRGAVAKNEMTRANLRLVVSFARRYTGLGVPLDDLIQEGNIGLMRAVERYDHRRGTRFSTYAAWWIRQALIQAVSDLGATIRIPRHARNTEAAQVATVPLDAAADPRGGRPRVETVGDVPLGAAFSIAAVQEERRLAHQLLDTLDERERRVIQMRLGFDGYRPHTLRETGEALGLTAERIRQIEAEAFAKLRELVSASS